MRALRQANVHTGAEFLTQAEYDALTPKNANTLYIISDAPAAGAAQITIGNVYVGTVVQSVLLDNTGAIAWIASDVSGHTNAAVNLTALI